MSRRPITMNPFRSVLVRLILGTDIEAERIRRAFQSLQESDQDCLRWVPRLLALED